MIPAKNFSPQQVAAIASFPIGFLGGVVVFFYGEGISAALLVFIFLSLASYISVYVMIQRFVYRKIKLIYKLIYQTKASKREEFYYKKILPQKSIQEVSEDVEKWAVQRKEEIDMLRKNEDYRKEFLMNLSHELKTPIFAIQGYVDTLLNGALNNPDVNVKFLSTPNRSVISRKLGLSITAEAAFIASS